MTYNDLDRYYKNTFQDFAGFAQVVSLSEWLVSLVWMVLLLNNRRWASTLYRKVSTWRETSRDRKRWDIWTSVTFSVIVATLLYYFPFYNHRASLDSVGLINRHDLLWFDARWQPSLNADLFERNVSVLGIQRIPVRSGDMIKVVYQMETATNTRMEHWVREVPSAKILLYMPTLGNTTHSKRWPHFFRRMAKVYFSKHRTRAVKTADSAGHIFCRAFVDECTLQARETGQDFRHFQAFAKDSSRETVYDFGMSFTNLKPCNVSTFLCEEPTEQQLRNIGWIRKSFSSSNFFNPTASPIIHYVFSLVVKIFLLVNFDPTTIPLYRCEMQELSLAFIFPLLWLALILCYICKLVMWTFILGGSLSIFIVTKYPLAESDILPPFRRTWLVATSHCLSPVLADLTTEGIITPDQCDKLLHRQRRRGRLSIHKLLRRFIIQNQSIERLRSHLPTIGILVDDDSVAYTSSESDSDDTRRSDNDRLLCVALIPVFEVFEGDNQHQTSLDYLMEEGFINGHQFARIWEARETQGNMAASALLLHILKRHDQYQRFITWYVEHFKKLDREAAVAFPRRQAANAIEPPNSDTDSE